MSETLKKRYMENERSRMVSEKEIDNAERLLLTFNAALETFFDTRIDSGSTVIDLGYGDGSFLKSLERHDIECKGYD